MFLFGWLRIACFLQVRETSPDLIWTQPKTGRELLKSAFAFSEFLVNFCAEIVGKLIDSKRSLL